MQTKKVYQPVENTKAINATAKQSKFQLVSVAEQAGLGLT